MKIFYLSKFVRQYKKLPELVRKEAEEKESIFRDNPFDARLETHKLHGALGSFYGFSVNRKYRIIFDFTDGRDVRFYAIGSHDIYE